MGIKGTKWVVKTQGQTTSEKNGAARRCSYEEKKYDEHRVHTSERKIFEAIQESRRCDEWN